MKPLESRTLAPDEKIGEPGIYAGVDIEFYHGDCTEGPGISSSGLRTIESKSPLHYWATSYLNPDRVPEEPKEHFDFGHAAHTLLLGESGFREQFAIRPCEWSDWRTKAAQQWKAEQQRAGRSVLTSDQVDAIKGIATSLAREPLVQGGVLQGAVEQTIAWKDGKSGVWLRARPDVMPSADGVVVDIKTTTDASPEAVQRTVLQHGYGMQGALVAMGLKAVCEVDMTDFVLVFVEKNPPYAVNITPVDQEWIYWSRRQLRRAIDIFARCIETGEWPGYQGERTTYMPDWLRRRFEAEEKGGLIPSAEEAA